MNDDNSEVLRQRALDLLAREGRAIHTGELAALLQAQTHQVQLALHPLQQTGKVCFYSSEGWSLPAAAAKPFADDQERLV